MSLLQAEDATLLVLEDASGHYLLSTEPVDSIARSPRRWTRKPPPGTDLDRRHAWCPDHCWPFLSPQGTAQCLARAAPLTPPTTRGDIYAGGSSMVMGRKYGLSVRHTVNTDLLRLTPDDSDVLDRIVPYSGGWTFLFCQRKIDTTNRVSVSFGERGQAPMYCTGYVPFSDGTVYFDYGNGQVEGVSRISQAGLTFGDDLWVFSTGPRGMEIWQNGLLRKSNTANPSRSRSSNTDRFALPGQEPNFSDFVDIALVMSWRRQLPAAAIRAVSANPWEVFQPVVTLTGGRTVVPRVGGGAEIGLGASWGLGGLDLGSTWSLS